MAADSLPNPVEAIQAQLRTALEAQLASLAASYQSSLDEAKRSARDEAEQEFAPRLDAVHAEWSSRLEAEVAAAREDAERRIVAEATRARVEAEQQAAESLARVREELEAALAAERHRGETSVASERARATAEIEALQARMRDAERALADARAEVESAARARGDAESAARTHAEAAERAAAEAAEARRQAEARPAAGAIEDLAAAGQALDRAGSLTATLDALLEHAARTAGRSAIFVVSGSRLECLKSSGLDAPQPGSLSGSDVIAEAVRSGESVATGDAHAAPSFAGLSAGGTAVAVPLRVGDRVVAVVYADDDGRGDGRGGWARSIEFMARHAAHVLSVLTAMRTLQALGGGDAAAAGDTADEEGARRYARLLVSEIRLYNESAVREGRRQRDLRQRLQLEIERARRLYDERVPSTVDGRAQFFQQELVQTLADGDASLLGTNA